jgi:serine/threonine-protein kinase RsbT
MMPHQLNKNRLYKSQELCTLVIEKEWQIARARQRVKSIAQDLGFNQVNTAQMITSLSELGYNLIFHSTNGGVVYVSKLQTLNAIGIKITCIDSGPGISSINEALSDGFSTNGGLGGGLPGAERLMDEFYITSSNDGTHIDCIKWNN